MKRPAHAAPSSSSHVIRRLLNQAFDALRRHWVFTLLFVIGVVLRIIVQLAYRPALLVPDSIDYLARSRDMTPYAWHPLGYPLFIRSLHVISNVTVVTAAQHVLVLVDALLLYLLLLRFGVRTWLAALGTAPILLDAFQLNVEQNILSESFFETMIVIAFVILLWRPRPGLWRCSLAGLLLAVASLTRFNGAILIVPALAFVVIRRVGILRVVALLLTFVLPIVAYAGWYDSVNGQFTVSGLSGVFLYGRVVSWADCTGLRLPSYERPLCPRVPPPDRPEPNWYVSSLSSPARKLTAHDGKSAESILQSFDLTIIEHQPLDYLDHTFSDYLRQFLPTHVDPKGYTESSNFFHAGYPGANTTSVTRQQAASAVATYFGGPKPSASVGLDRFLIQYQRIIYTWGPLLAGSLVISLLALIGVGSARRSRRRAECLTLLLAGVFLFLFANATALFGWRYQLPTLFLVPPGAVLSLAMIWPRLRSERWSERDASDTARPEVIEEPAERGDGSLAPGTPPGASESPGLLIGSRRSNASADAGWRTVPITP